MITAFDRVTLEVPDLDKALGEYGELLGQQAVCDSFLLGNLQIRLEHVPSRERTVISKLSLLDETATPGSEHPVDCGPRQIAIARSHYRQPGEPGAPTATGIHAVDHIVLQSTDADDCIRLFRDELGIRLALDQEVPEWGGRMLFFRMGKMTLEVIQSLKEPPERDFFWGITYLCRDIDETVAALDQRGVSHSPIRIGRKPGTRVATVKSHHLGLPTLLIAQ